MIALRLTVPIACWRKGRAREFLESEPLPLPATCYGALLSLVGEEDPERHRGCRVTSGLLNDPERSTVLRTLWQIKKKNVTQGTGENAGPDFQQVLVGSDIVIWCDSQEESGPAPRLEDRVSAALQTAASLSRFGGWSLGESTHLVNDAWLVPDGVPPRTCRAFLADPRGTVTLPVWVDHVGTAATRYAVGRIESMAGRPDVERIPRIPPHDEG